MASPPSSSSVLCRQGLSSVALCSVLCWCSVSPLSLVADSVSGSGRDGGNTGEAATAGHAAGGDGVMLEEINNLDDNIGITV